MRDFTGLLYKFAGLISEDGTTFILPPGKTVGHVVAEWNAAHPDQRITADQVIRANDGLAANKYRAGTAYRMPGAPGPVKKNTAPAAAQNPPAAAPAIDYEQLSPAQQELTRLLYDEARHYTNDMPYIASAVYNRSGGTNHVVEAISAPAAFSGRRKDGTYASTKNRDANPKERAAWNEAMRQATAIFSPDYTPVTTATHFHAPSVSPAWKKGRTPLTLAGTKHKFYDDVPFVRPWNATPRPNLTDDNRKEYIVREGENFSTIGSKLGIPYSWLQEWNSSIPEKKLQPGQTIRYADLPADYRPLRATGKIIAEELKK